MAMKKRVVIPLILSVILSSCSLKKEGPSALQISSTPKSTIFLGDKELGKTPYYDEKIKSGEYVLKIVPDNSQYVTWETKIKLNPDVLTVINRDLGLTEETSAGVILNLEKITVNDSSDVSIVTTPNLANVKFDNQDQGQSPVLVKNTTPSDHEVSVTLPGYIDKTVKIKTVAGYKLNASIQLASITANMPSVPTETNAASVSANNKTPSPSSSPSSKSTSTPKPTPSPSEGPVTDPNKVLILDTPTGWLRVRSDPSLNATESGKVNPGEKYPYISETAGWVEIEFQAGKQGWVSSQYVKKIKE